MSWNEHWKIDEGYLPLFEQLRASPEKVLRQLIGPNILTDRNFGKPETLEVVSIPIVPDDGHMYWVFGHSQTPTGLRIPSIFVTSDGGGCVLETYWHVGGHWHYHYDTAAHEHLKQDCDHLVPFEMEFAVPVEFSLDDVDEQDD